MEQSLYCQQVVFLYQQIKGVPLPKNCGASTVVDCGELYFESQFYSNTQKNGGQNLQKKREPTSRSSHRDLNMQLIKLDLCKVEFSFTLAILLDKTFCI